MRRSSRVSLTRGRMPQDRDTLLQAPARKMRAVLAVINTQLLRSTVLKDMNLDKNSPIVVRERRGGDGGRSSGDFSWGLH